MKDALIPEDEAQEWAWQQIKKDCGLNDLTVGEEIKYYGAFNWGWTYRKQYEKQKKEEG